MRVALESTVIAHGLPRPLNHEAATACERIVRECGAEPATVGIVAGRPVVGLSEDEIREIATRDDVVKVGLHNLGATMARGEWGATTVSASIHLASRVDIRVLATGGIGGVHRDRTFDVSSDLTALATTPVLVVCAGAKSILDLPRTLETLETLGVPVVGYATNEFPAFYARTSGLALSLAAPSPYDAARIAYEHWEAGLRSAVLVTVPCPTEAAIAEADLASVVDRALEEADRQRISGSTLTPFLLSRIALETSGRSLVANLALLENNARVAGLIAVALKQIAIVAERRGPLDATGS